MAAYATTRHQLGALGDKSIQSSFALATVSAIDHTLGATAQADPPRELSGSVIDQVIDQLAERIAIALADRLAGGTDPAETDEWLDSRRAAEYLDVHRDTLRKLAAERAIPSEQDGPGCKLYFRRTDLDRWRRSGGRPCHLASTLRRAA